MSENGIVVINQFPPVFRGQVRNLLVEGSDLIGIIGFIRKIEAVKDWRDFAQNRLRAFSLCFLSDPFEVMNCFRRIDS